MLPAFLVPEATIHENGTGAIVEIPAGAGTFLITLGINNVIEQQSLHVSIQISSDGSSWDPAPLVEFPQKFYPGVSSVLVDMAAHPSAKFLRAEWKVNRWGRGSKMPSFTFYVFVEPA